MLGGGTLTPDRRRFCEDVNRDVTIGTLSNIYNAILILIYIFRNTESYKAKNQASRPYYNSKLGNKAVAHFHFIFPKLKLEVLTDNKLNFP